MKNERLLTDVELELMNILWDRGESTVREVLDSLPASRELAYTSVATMLRILEEKDVARSRKDERTLSYAPVLGREEYEKRSLKHLEREVFRGDRSSMVLRLISDSTLSSKELQSIRALLNERLRK
jgi:predicted transcriptional regulator